MPPKNISDFTSIELLKAQQQTYEQLIRTQNDLQVIVAEIKRREEADVKKREDESQKVNRQSHQHLLLENMHAVVKKERPNYARLTRECKKDIMCLRSGK